MMTRLSITVFLVALSLTACGPQEQSADTDGTWVGTITTEGNFTTVVNESGSVWGGAARLVEEASIGVDVGPPEYMLGSVDGLGASDEHIYVGDGSLPAIRVYDYDGQHVRDIGRAGQGPGEFNRLMGLNVASDGTLYVYADRHINVFSPEGEPLDTWQHDTGFESNTPPVLTLGGTLYIRDRVRGAGAERLSAGREVMRAAGPGGPSEEVMPVPEIPHESYDLVIEMGRGRATYSMPFAPDLRWVLAPTGAMIAGVSADYRFEVHAPDGAVTVVEKAWEPVAIDAAQAAWNRQQMTERMRSQAPEWQWNGPDIPARAPAFAALYADGQGRVWAYRIVSIERREGCDPETPDPETGRAPNCWTSTYGYDVFGTDGRFLGSIDDPPRLFTPVFHGDQVFGYAEDDAGVGTVKRYRLVPPGQE